MTFRAGEVAVVMKALEKSANEMTDQECVQFLIGRQPPVGFRSPPSAFRSRQRRIPLLLGASVCRSAAIGVNFALGEFTSGQILLAQNRTVFVRHFPNP